MAFLTIAWDFVCRECTHYKRVDKILPLSKLRKKFKNLQFIIPESVRLRGSLLSFFHFI